MDRLGDLESKSLTERNSLLGVLVKENDLDAIPVFITLAEKPGSKKSRALCSGTP